MQHRFWETSSVIFEQFLKKKNKIIHASLNSITVFVLYSLTIHYLFESYIYLIASGNCNFFCLLHEIFRALIISPRTKKGIIKNLRFLNRFEVECNTQNFILWIIELYHFGNIRFPHFDSNDCLISSLLNVSRS